MIPAFLTLCRRGCRFGGEWAVAVVLGFGHAIERRTCPVCGRTETRWADAK